MLYSATEALKAIFLKTGVQKIAILTLIEQGIYVYEAIDLSPVNGPEMLKSRLSLKSMVLHLNLKYASCACEVQIYLDTL